MCTVVYLPQTHKSILASIRDESPFRPTEAPCVAVTDYSSFLCPTDLKSGGTWFGTNSIGLQIVLLNGAFINHLPNTRTFRTSRGSVIKQLLVSQEPIETLLDIDYSEVEPFTIIVKFKDQLIEFRWDSKETHFRFCAIDEPQIWSSSTLYPSEIREKRKRLFLNWTDQHQEFNKESLIGFFKSYTDPLYGFFMKRSENLCSISFSYLESTLKTGTYCYHDLISNFKNTTTLMYATFE